MPSDKWTREQTIVALNLYCKIPFNKVSSKHPDIIRIAKIIARTPNSVKMKIGNFGSFDPELKKRGIVGLGNTSKLDEIIWKEPLEKIIEIDIDDIPAGKEREAIIKARINQSFFCSTILSSYNCKCCITGLSIPDFLVAGHIIPWAKDEKNRLNPHNGLCLNSIHDKAFDKGFITISTDYKIKVLKYFNDFRKEDVVADLFFKYENKSVQPPIAVWQRDNDTY
jgi:putative restriction endonuclease